MMMHVNILLLDIDIKYFIIHYIRFMLHFVALIRKQLDMLVTQFKSRSHVRLV